MTRLHARRALPYAVILGVTIAVFGYAYETDVVVVQLMAAFVGASSLAGQYRIDRRRRALLRDRTAPSA